MNHLTPADLNAINQLFIFIAVFACAIGLFLASYFYTFYKKIERRINFPQRVKTEEGYLYRSQNGTYVSKQRCEEIFIEKKFKKLDFYIAFHTRILKRLKSERVSTSDSGNQNPQSSSL